MQVRQVATYSWLNPRAGGAGRPAFTLTELLVVGAIVGLLMVFLLPAIQKTRDVALRLSCANNLRQLGVALNAYHSDHGRFPLAAKYDYATAYTWYHELLPYLSERPLYEQFHNLHLPGVVDGFGGDEVLAAARGVMPKVMRCPADGGLAFTEIGDLTRRRALGNYRACVGEGDVYAETGVAGNAAFPGVFTLRRGHGPATPLLPAECRLTDIADGPSNTLLLSEGLVSRPADGRSWGGPLGDVQTARMGGAYFSTRLPPNAAAADSVWGPCPTTVGDMSYRQPCTSLGPSAERQFGHAAGALAAARSRHHAGVNALFADGAVRFITATIHPPAWQAMGTRDKGDVIDEYAKPPRTGPILILFVGNSYTQGNDLPNLIRQLAESAREVRPIIPDAQLVGGATLEQHYNDGVVQKKLAERPYEYVVLQEQSMRPILDTRLMHEYARKLDGEIKASGASTLFFMTWARKHLPETQAKLAEAYQSIAGELGAEVAPVGLAWQRTQREHPEIELYDADNSHPTLKGSYLAACVFYATIYKRSPQGLAPLGLSVAEAQVLQRIAWETVQVGK